MSSMRDDHGAGESAERPHSLDGERLAELAVDSSAQVSEAERALLASDAELSSELAELKRFVGAQRELAQRTPVALSADLTERILDSTTRRRPSWTGDLRLVRDLVLLRCRQSVWVRIAAASLLLHLAALPVVAWFVLHEAPAKQQIFFESPGPVELPVEPAEEIEVEAPDVNALLAGDGLSEPTADAVRNARRLGRFLLQSDGAPEVAGLPVDGLLEQVLAARSAGILTSDWSGLPGLEAVRDEPLALALRAEVLLDRVLLQGELEGLREGLLALDPMEERLGAEVKRVVRSTVLRAMQLGLDDAALRFEWRVEAWAGPELEQPGERAGEALSSRWFTQLEHALEGRSVGRITRAWLDWARR